MDLTKQDNQSQGLSDNSSIQDNSGLQAMLDYTSERTRIIENFIQQQLIDGTDFGSITIKGTKSKASLLKPGSEKLLNLFRLTAIFKRDDETWEVLGKKPNLICMVCQLMDQSGHIVGEGRGTALVTNMTMDFEINKQVKIAEKRAQVDATLRTFALSGRFTQDMEDYKEQDKIKTAGIAFASDAKIRLDPNSWLTIAQHDKIDKTLRDVNKRGHNITESAIAAKFNKKSIDQLTVAEAGQAITRLLELSNQGAILKTSNSVQNNPVTESLPPEEDKVAPPEFGSLVGKIFNLLKELKIDMKDYGKDMKARYGTSLLKSLRDDQLQEIVDELEEMLTDRIKNPRPVQLAVGEMTPDQISNLLGQWDREDDERSKENGK